MTQLTTPYNFVPLSSTVYFPPWAKDSRQLSHDAPLQNGWCGSVRIRITADTPLLVAGTQNGAERHPLKVMDKYAIPGSSLRGMLRNVLEIATFGKFGRAVNDRAMSIRDLTPSGDVYRTQINANTVHSGWLKLSAGLDASTLANIEPTAMIRMDEAEASECARDARKEGKDPYEVATDDVDPTTQKMEKWIVVRTGAVSKKREDFLFRTRSTGTVLTIARDLFQQFAAAHQHNPLWSNKNGEPGDLQKRLMSGKRTPVFFIYDPKDKTRVQAFGLAYMFRVPYRHSLHDAIKFSGTAHHDQSQLDFCEALLGLIHDGKDNHPISLRSRVGFGLALATQAKAHQGLGVEVVLNEPKPSFYPAYVKNGQTLMSERPQLAGWKRYPVRTEAAPQNTNANRNENIGSKLFALEAGATFEGDITLHNLHPEELGGLFWALTWGQQTDLRHSLGMGRPFGFGSLKIEVIKLDLRHNADASQDIQLSDTQDKPAMAEAIQRRMQAFEQAMEVGVKNWASTEQIKELQAMANPALGDRIAQQLRYMPLANFRLVKGGRGNIAQTLKRFTVIAQP